MIDRFLDHIATHILAFEGNYGPYIDDLTRRKGADADQAHRITHEPLVRQ